jgi:ABC-type multidrug transport system fused ATPase/permease subunit
MCLRVAINLHDMLFRGVTRATMWFFNQNSSGRILNRFSKDVGTIDSNLPVVIVDCLQVNCLLNFSFRDMTLNFFLFYAVLFSVGNDSYDCCRNKSLAINTDIIHVHYFLWIAIRFSHNRSKC